MSNKNRSPFNAYRATNSSPAEFGHALGIPLDRPNRNIGQPNTPPAPVTSAPGRGDRETEIYTLFTLVGQQGSKGTPILYNNERQWAQVTLVLETAGPVAVGTRADLFPVLSGKGELLQTNVEMTFTLGKGQNRLYYAANAVSRVKVVIQPFPWLEEITSNLREIRDLLARGR